MKTHFSKAKYISIFVCTVWILGIGTIPSLLAQTDPTIVATNYLRTNADKQKLSPEDLNGMTVSSAYVSPTTGWYHIYFNQTQNDIEVYNALMNVVMKNGQVVYANHSFVSGLALKATANPLTITMNPQASVVKATKSVGLKSSALAEISRTQAVNGITNKVTFSDATIANGNIEAKLYWYPYQALVKGKTTTQVTLTWNVRFNTKDGNNAWNIQVDAFSGEILSTIDDVVHCDFGNPTMAMVPFFLQKNKETKVQLPDATRVTANTYNVFDYPLESPNHGSRTTVSSPYTRFVPTGTGPGTTNGWHEDGTNSYTNTKGNNVDAKDDIANDNESTLGSSPSSASLDFNYSYTQSTGTAASNLNAAITNLFYWNNIMHDVLWKYGFDEPSGNFQKNNMGRGGADNDLVYADAQDGSGTNNANFLTPADGTNGRMQMYIWSNAGSPAYQPDSDFDNGVIAHEYGHGWSNRLTGGPANSSCLQNVEQAGEGWSDYALLMFTTNWASLTPTLASANIPRGVGTYVKGQDPVSGAGIRPYRYSYDKATYNNPVTYVQVGNSAFSEPHGIGSIWATIIWDMTWEIIFQDNYIAPNIYDVPANITDYKGNIAALKLVTEGLRLQPCSPSFVDSRDAIFQADAMLFGGRYRCAIGKAFARRGLGLNASTGISSNDRTVTEDFTPFFGPILSSPFNNIACSGQVFNYTPTVGVSGTYTFAWTRAAVAGISNGASSGSGNISETLINTTISPITVTYNYTVTPETCGGTAGVQAVKVVVNPVVAPTVANYSICQNATVPNGEGLVVPSAYTDVVNGTLVAGPTYVRGNGSNVTTYTAATGVGSSVYYKTFTFVSPITGNVNFEITAANLTGTNSDDTYLTLYQTSFNPASPATNFLHGDDDGGNGFLSKITHSLTAGSTYVLVVSTYANNITGTFTMQTSVAGFVGGINQWYLNPTGGTPLATGEVFNPVGVSGSGIPNTATIGNTNFYVANALIPSCRTLTTFSVIGSVGGSVSSDAVCSTTNSGTLTLTGYTGTILRWESSTDNFSTITTIANTTATQTYSNIAQTTQYRAVVQNGTCTAANSSPATVILITVTANSNSPVNEGGNINLSAITTGTSFAWTGPNSYTSTIQNPSISSATVAMSGIYTISVSSTAGTCVATATTSVIVNPTSTSCSPPTGAMAGSNSPVIVGGTISLTSSSTGGTSQVWAGPNSFSSTSQNPNIPSATLPMAGVYTVTITSSGTCTATATTSVIVNPAPTSCSPPTGAMAGSNSPVIVGGTISLTSSSTGGTSQVWAGPNSFSSTSQNPNIPSATLPMAGVYTVIITSSGTCTATATVNVSIVPPPTVSIIYVNAANASPTQNGTSWALAYSNLATALAAATAGVEVWVAQGTYKPTNLGNRNLSFNIPSGVKVYGGFVGSESIENQRNFRTNETILSGDIGTTGIYTDDSYHVVSLTNTNNQTLLDGFTIKDGYGANQPPVSNSQLNIASLTSPFSPSAIESGGGIYIQGGSPVIANCTIQNNFAIFGAGVYAESSTASINLCRIRGNFATFGGGNFNYLSNISMSNSLVSGNKGLGAGIYNNESSPILSNITVVSNDGFVGGIYDTSTSVPVVKNSIIWNNTNWGFVKNSLANVTYSLVQETRTGVGNLTLNPNFVSQVAANTSPTIAGDYQLTNISPAIDAGNNGAILLTDKDLLGNLRLFAGKLVDMGAYEFQGNRVGQTVTSIATGNWESGSTWDIGRSPLAGDDVVINNNHTVTVNNTSTVRTLTIKSNAMIINAVSTVKIQLGY